MIKLVRLTRVVPLEQASAFELNPECIRTLEQREGGFPGSFITLVGGGCEIVRESPEAVKRLAGIGVPEQ